MKLLTIAVSTLIALSSFIPALAHEPSEADVARAFKGYEGCLVIKCLKTGHVYKFNEERCAKRFSPCSTFKIMNSLIALETGVLKDENSAFKWDGTKYSFSFWNHDHTLRSAVSNSVVWYFKKVASLIGEERMKEYLSKVGYGNEDISRGLTTFWLGSGIEISADEQVAMIEKLIKEELPFSKRNMAIVRGILRYKETEKGTLYGKTGSDVQNDKGILGWYVGYVVTPDGIHVFAANTSADDGASGPKTRKRVIELLEEMKLL